MLKAENTGAADRTRLAEIRQSYLMRQQERFRHEKKPVAIKPDYYDSDPSRNVYGKFPIDKPTALPYYVVPVLYVPQKVMSSDRVDNNRNCSEYVKVSPRKSPQPMVQSEESDYDDSEDFDEKSISNDEESLISSHLEPGVYRCPIGQKPYDSTFQIKRNPYGDCDEIHSRFKEIFERNFEDPDSDSPCEHLEFPDARRTKICINCLKDKYLKRRNSSGSDESRKYNSRAFSDSKSTQTLNPTKANSATQTELREFDARIEPERKASASAKGKTSQIPQPRSPEFRDSADKKGKWLRGRQKV